MGSPSSSGWRRRELLGAAALLAAVVGVPTAVLVSRTDEKDAPTDRQREMMRRVSDIVLPRSDTPGAGEAGVGEFVLLALVHGLDGSREPVASSEVTSGLRRFLRPDGSLRYADWLERTLDGAAGGDWLGDSARQAQVLAAVDADAYRQGAPPSPWRKIKGLILTGYYTSEPGASQELQYELVPRRYEPALPLKSGTRAYSSDWTAVDFG